MDVRIDWNYSALAEVRNSPDVVKTLENLASVVLGRANYTLKTRKGYVMSSHTGPGKYNRHICNIYPIGAEAKASNARNNTLAKIL